MGHPFPPKASFDGGDLDCGNGLLLLIRKHIDPLAPGELLEIRSRELSVDEELPAWCRMTGNELVSRFREGKESSFLVSKGVFGTGALESPRPSRDRPWRLLRRWSPRPSRRRRSPLHPFARCR